MLRSLAIKNYAIIDQLNIDFENGFNVFTGETGAGKSIIVGALSLLFKGKADTSIIRTGQEKTTIEGVFDLQDYMIPILQEADIDYDDQIIIRRTITKDNKNTIKLNDVTITLSLLNDILGTHIDIHSQRDNQFLLNKKNHLMLLDKYANNNKEFKDYNDKYNLYTKELTEYNSLLNENYNERDLEYFKFDLEELEKAKLSINEETELINKEKRFKDSEKYINVLTNTISLYENDNCAKDNLYEIIKTLNIEDETINNVKNNIENAYYSINDEINILKDLLQSFTSDDESIDYIEERLYTYSKLKRKHNLNVEGLLNLQNELKDKIQIFEDKDIVLQEKLSKVNDLKNDCIQAGIKLSETRKAAAKNLEKKVITECEDLMLTNVEFKTLIEECELNKNGIDNIEFYISLNKGEELKPLKDVASGGEISRLMLALKTIFLSYSNCLITIFDEIDTGVSGKEALAMGKKMKEISKDVQTIAITHLAPVAACANTHYYIYKTDNSNTRVKILDSTERLEEIASISSTEKSQKAIEAAKELIELAQK